MNKYTFKYNLVPNTVFKYESEEWRKLIYGNMYLDMKDIISSDKIEEIIKIVDMYKEGIIVVIGKDNNFKYIPNVEDENMIVISIIKEDNQQPSSNFITIKDILYILEKSDQWIYVYLPDHSCIILPPTKSLDPKGIDEKQNHIKYLLDFKIKSIKGELRDSGYGGTFSPDYYPCLEIVVKE